ncbi:unnamed protein product, partial [Rotaria sp. Silwood2]
EKEDRQAIRKEDFILDKLNNETIYQLPGLINEQQFIVQNFNISNYCYHC